jgi:hypothetical protein
VKLLITAINIIHAPGRRKHLYSTQTPSECERGDTAGYGRAGDGLYAIGVLDLEGCRSNGGMVTHNCALSRYNAYSEV